MSGLLDKVNLATNRSVINDIILLSKFLLPDILEKCMVTTREYEHMLCQSDTAANQTAIFMLNNLGYTSGYWHSIPTKYLLKSGEHIWKIDSIEKVQAATRMLLLLAGADLDKILDLQSKELSTVPLIPDISNGWWICDWRMTVAYCSKIYPFKTAEMYGKEFPYIMVKTQIKKDKGSLSDLSFLYLDIDRKLYSEFYTLRCLPHSVADNNPVFYSDTNIEYNLLIAQNGGSTVIKSTGDAGCGIITVNGAEIKEKPSIFNTNSIYLTAYTSTNEEAFNFKEAAGYSGALRLISLLADCKDTSFAHKLYLAGDIHPYLPREKTKPVTASQVGKVVFRNIVKSVESDDKSPILKTLIALNDVELKLVSSPSEEVFNTLELEFPWFLDIINYLRKNAQLTRKGHGIFYIRPLLISGPPGNGKTSLARRFAELTMTSCLFLPLAGISDAQGLKGANRTWGTARPSNITEHLAKNKIANPVIILDEVDKINTSRHNGNSSDALIQLLEPSSSASYFDEFVAAPSDFSSINYILTANHLPLVFAPLVNRCTVIETQPLTKDQLRIAFLQSLRNVCKYYGIKEVPHIEESVIDVVADTAYDLRGLERAAEICLATVLA